MNGCVKISRHHEIALFICFLFFSTLIYTLILARDSSKKWQEIINNPAPDWIELQKFLVTIIFCCFFLFFYSLGSRTISRVDSQKFLVTFLFLFFLFLYITLILRGIVLKSDKKLYTSSVWFRQMKPCCNHFLSIKTKKSVRYNQQLSLLILLK